MVDDTDPRLIWRGLGRGLDRCYPPDRDQPDSIEQLMNALRARDKDSGQNSDAR